MSQKKKSGKTTPETLVREKKRATGRRRLASVSDTASVHVENVILIRTDLSGKINQINPFGKSFFGKTDKEIMGRRFVEIALSAEDRMDRRRHRFVHYFCGNSAEKDIGEFGTCHVSGNPRRVAWTRSRVHDSDRGVDEILYVGMDVHKFPPPKIESPAGADPDTLKSGAESHFCVSNAKHGLLESYIEDSNVWAWELGKDGNICYVSPGVEKALGYSPDELIGRTMKHILPEDEAKRFRMALDGAVDTGTRHFRVNCRALLKNGRHVWAETSGIVLYEKSGAFLGARGLNRDITREMGLKEELLLRQQEYRYLFDNTQVALSVAAEDGTILNINQTFADIHGNTPEKMIGRKFTEFLPETERDASFEAFTNSFQRAKSQTDRFVDISPYLTKIETSRGKRYIKLVPIAVKVFESNKLVGILNTAIDITESRKLCEDLKKHQRHLQQLVDDRTQKIRALQEEMFRNERLTALGRMTATVSHEIRNPLGTISSSLYVVNERVKKTEAGVAPAIARGFRAIRRCDGVIEELLDFTRTKRLEKEMLNLAPVLEKFLDEKIIPEKMSIIRKVEPKLKVQIDRNRFFRCMSNILENAVDAIGSGKKGKITINARLSDECLEICVEDTGCGIEKKHLKSIYEPLYSTKQAGIGLGLPICKQIMNMHDGTIDIRSEVGKGTSVILRLPTLNL